MFKDEILENARRHKIYNTIMNNPGLHIRQLQRTLNIPLSSLQHHLSYMAQRNVIIEEKSEHFTRYYCNPLNPEDKRVLSVLRQKRLREIIMIILVEKKAKYQFIVQTLELPPSTISFYLKCLLDNQIIERTKIGYENVYTLKDEDRIAKILVAYKRSFTDTLIDKWASAWLENRFGKDGSKEEKA